MRLGEAVARRIKELCAEKGISLYQLSLEAGLPNSTIYNMVKPTGVNSLLLNLKKVCDALEISMKDFFSAPYFDELESDIDD